MALGGVSGCVNHLGVEAVGRCKQCGKPFCSACRVQGATGNFCSGECKEKHEAFVQRTHQLEQMRKGGGVARLKRLVSKAVVKGVILLALVVGVGFAAEGLGVEIPVLSGVIKWMRALIGI